MKTIADEIAEASTKRTFARLMQGATLDVMQATHVGSVAALLVRVSKAFAVDVTEIASESPEPGSVLLLLPAEVVGPVLFVSDLTGEQEDRIAAVFNARPAWIDLTIARVPRNEFDAARAAFRLGGRAGVFARWQTFPLV